MSRKEKTGAIVRTWASGQLPEDVSRALRRLAHGQDVQRIAVMPDVHLAEDVCIGTVLATSRLIYPNAVGGDIGCGIATVALNGGDPPRDEPAAHALLTALRGEVPIMRHGSSTSRPALPESLRADSLSHETLARIARRDGRIQFGTLGRGNHFLELQQDEDGRMWLMVHSGSRAIGQAVRDHHLARVAPARGGLAALDAETDPGQTYLDDARWARAYAAASRRAMVDAAGRVIAEHLGAQVDHATYLDCDHNHVQPEEHFGKPLWVHRKGAVSAQRGEAGLIPGSMGTASYHVRGRGLPDSLCSSSHGAGRVMSRGEARRRISGPDLLRQLAGVWFDRRAAAQLREEAPAAYKDIDQVMRAQRKLTRIVRRLRPVLCLKGG